MASVIKLGIGVGLLLLMIRGTYDLIFKISKNKCEMTYMFEVPQYVKIPISYHNSTKGKYSLYAYGEGLYAELLKRGLFKGIPVLFIPGNQGSYKQVRSLASVAYRKAQDENYSFNFNFFAVDFVEELSAIYGPVLEEQTEFVGLAIREILRLYKDAKKKPSSVILVGHSLGGLVARAVAMLPEIPASQVPLIVTQATPHTRPVIVLDPHVSDFYDKVNRHWQIERFGDFKDIVLVTVGGGRNDIQVSTHFTATEMADIDATTLSVPACWLTTDHLAIVWCHQLVLATARALFDSIDPSTFSVSSDRNRVVNSFKYQLVARSGSKNSFLVGYPSIITKLEKNAVWSEANISTHYVEKLKPSKHNFLMIPIHNADYSSQHLTIIGRELDWKNWVFACKAAVLPNGSKICSSGINLSQDGRIIPGMKKELNVDLMSLSLQDVSHVVVWIRPCDDKVQIALDMSDRRSHNKEISAPTFMSSFAPVIITEATPPGALSFNLTVKEFSTFWQSYVLRIEPNNSCQRKTMLHPHVSMSSSWTHRWEYIMSRDDPYEFLLEVDVLDRSDWNPQWQPEVHLHIILYQHCTYKISLQKSLTGIFSRISLLYGPQLPAYIGCHFLLVLSSQMKSFSLNKKCSSVFSLLLGLTPVVVVPFVKIFSYLLFRFCGIESDSMILAKYNIDVPVLPIMFFLAFLPVSIICTSGLWVLVIVSGNAAHSFAVKLLKRAIRTGDILTEIAVAGFWKVPAIAAVALVALALSSCGALALSIGAALYFIKIFKLYEDYLESFLISLIPGTQEAHEGRQMLSMSTIHLHFTMMLLTILVALLNIPTLLTWSRNMANDIGIQLLPSDPSLIPSILCIIAHGIMWQIKTVNPNKILYKQLGYLLHSSSVLVLLFGSVNLYRISYIISSVLLIIAVHQLFAPSRESGETNGDHKYAYMEVLKDKKSDSNGSPENKDNRSKTMGSSPAHEENSSHERDSVRNLRHEDDLYSSATESSDSGTELSEGSSPD